MGTATTFAELIAAPSSEKVFLAELTLAQQLQNWAPPASYGHTFLPADGAVHLSWSAGNAMFWIEGQDLSDYAGTEGVDTPYKVTVLDGSGRKVIAYCGAVGGGLTKGAELLTDNTFDVSGSWVKWPGWTVSGGKAVAVSVTSAKRIEQEPTLIVGALYEFIFDILTVTSGGVRAFLTYSDEPAWPGPLHSAVGTYTDYINSRVTSANGDAGLMGPSSAPSFSGTADNLYLKQITDCPVTGLHLISAKNGAVHNVLSADTGFDSQDIISVTLEVGSVYSQNFLNETITLADGTTETIRKVVTSVEENGVAYTAKASIIEVRDTASTYWHDTTNGVLYIHTSGNDSPNNYTIVVFFELRFATKGIVLNSKYYEPYVADRGIPQLSQETPEIHWGVSGIGSGSIELLNGRGFFDQIAKTFIWNNKRAKILLGGDLLPYSEYQAIFTGRIVDTIFRSDNFSLSLRSNSFDLLRSLPVNDFWTATYPNLDPAAVGTPIPLYWGDYSAVQAPVVTCINTAYGANVYQFKICDTTHHAIKAITQVYIDYGDGAGWQTIAHANESLAAATFTITSASFVVGISRVKVAFQGYHSGGVLIEGAPEIAEDILTTWCGYAAAALDSTTFTASKAISTATLNVHVANVESALSIIERICGSDRAFFDENGAGQLRYRTWEPSQTGTIPVLDALEILADPAPEITDDSTNLYWRVKVGYSYACADGKYLFAEESTAASRYKYGKNETLELETYLRGSADADALAARMNWVTRDPSPILSLALKTAQIDKNLGDKIKVTLARAPYGTAGGYVERVFELVSKSLSCFPVLQELRARDLGDFGNNVGFWMADTAPAWGAATVQEQEDSGFWTDDYGLVDPTDPTSVNKSLLW